MGYHQFAILTYFNVRQKPKEKYDTYTYVYVCM